MRMFFEELRGSLVRLGPHQCKGAHMIAGIFDALGRDGFGLAQRTAHFDNGSVVFLHPPAPGIGTGLLLRLTLALGQCDPGLECSAVLAAEEYGEISVGAHGVSCMDVQSSKLKIRV